MFSFLSPSALARRSARHPWLTVGFWVLLLAAAIVSAGNLQLDETQSTLGAESERATATLESLHGKEPVKETVVVQSVGATVDDAHFSGYVAELRQHIAGLTTTVQSVTSYYDSHDESLVSKDRPTTILPVVLKGDLVDSASNVEPLIKLLKASDGDGMHAMTVGDGSINKELSDTAENDLLRGEGIGLPAALVVLLFVFGAAVAAGVPVLLGLAGILVSVGITSVISRFFGIGSFTINIITMIGLAVGIDYTLFIVERFREERQGRTREGRGDRDGRQHRQPRGPVLRHHCRHRARGDVHRAIDGLPGHGGGRDHGCRLRGRHRADAAAGCAQPARGQGQHAPPPRPRQGEESRSRIGILRLDDRDRDAPPGDLDRRLGDHPRRRRTAVFTISLGSAGVSQMPPKLDSVQAFMVLDREFSAGRIAPAEVVIKGDVQSPAVQQAIAALRQRLAQDPAFADASAVETSRRGDIAAFNVLVNGDPTDPAASRSVKRLRNDYIPATFRGTGAEVLVGGSTASTIDYVDTMNKYLPIVIAFVLTLSFILLLMVFRSIVIPVKAIVMNLLSVGAAYGLIVLVFQHGFGADQLDLQQSDQIGAFLPIFLFAVLFGLSMDYHVFLLSRIQERFLKTRDNRGSVSYGLRSTAHIITGAAAIMMMVFGGFALGDMVELQQVGFGLAVAVLLDATIVRSILVPASMEMLGEWNWYFPTWLNWLPRITVEGPREQYEPAPQGIVPELIGVGGD